MLEFRYEGFYGIQSADESAATYCERIKEYNICNKVVKLNQVRSCLQSTRVSLNYLITDNTVPREYIY